MSGEQDEFEALTGNVGQPRVSELATEMHVDLEAFQNAGFTRQEAFQLVRDARKQTLSYLYGIAFHNDVNGLNDDEST